MAVSKFNPEVICRIRDKLTPLLDQLGKELGFAFTAGRATYSDSMFTMKIECALLQADGKPVRKEANAFKQLASVLGMKPEDLGREFQTPQGKRYRLVGFMAKRRKFPMLCEDVSTGKEYCLPELTVQKALGY